MKSVSFILLFWYIFPAILLFACNYIVQRMSLFKKYKIKSPDIATPFLFIGLSQISTLTFSVSAIPYLVLMISLLGIIIAVSYARYYGYIQYKRYFKLFWRSVFLLVCLFYLILIVTSLFYHK
ncbi:DUF3397 domain-containing protein [Vagococcus humatus]|uniref:DUF3397 domain-containing protein n=1 Tax=Vagococcus humatus TaxID=1889241 RepID=A0A429Z702_9ENTE|nr:DUF3397 domain-containing protein [Vagococcus humatus]RST89458.1 DUF3397 domain-containing protein [Vagococcus humatus]